MREKVGRPVLAQEVHAHHEEDREGNGLSGNNRCLEEGAANGNGLEERVGRVLECAVEKSRAEAEISEGSEEVIDFSRAPLGEPEQFQGEPFFRVFVIFLDVLYYFGV